MAKQKDIVKMPKKKGFSDYIIYIVIAVAIVIVCVWAGYVVDETASGKGADYQKAFTHCMDYLDPNYFGKAIVRLITTDESYTRQFAFIGLMGGILVFALGANQSNKRYHRKGEEHGSAHWGADSEKRIIQDENDFINNVIVASDVFLVIDRDKREKNALSNGQIKKKEKEKTKAEIKEAKRKARIYEEYKEFQKKNSPLGN